MVPKAGIEPALPKEEDFKSPVSADSTTWALAKGVGFEPTDLPVSGFQDRRLKPLDHPFMCGMDGRI